MTITPTYMSQTKDTLEPEKSRLSFFWKILIGMFLMIALSIYVICIYTPPFVISEKTTRITSPLTADGQVNFFRYIEETYYPQKLADDDNGYRIFVQKFGDVINSNDFLKKQTYEKLGLDISIPPTMSFPDDPFQIVFDHYAAQNKSSSSSDNSDWSAEERKYKTESLAKLWTLDEYPMLADWIENSNTALDEIADTFRKSIFFIPYCQVENSNLNENPDCPYFMFDQSVPNFSRLAKRYQARANYRIAKGNIPDAIDDIITIYRIGRVASQKGNIAGLLHGYNIGNIANSIPLDANPKYQVSKKEYQRILDAINQLTSRATLEEELEFRRILMLSHVQKLFRDGWQDFQFSNPHPFPFSSDTKKAWCNFNMVCYFVNEFYDEAIRFVKNVNEFYDPAIDERWKKLHQHYYFNDSQPFEKFKLKLTSYGRGKTVATVMMFHDDIFYTIMSERSQLERADCLLNMKRLSLALSMYKSEYGEFPKEDWIEKIEPYFGDDFEKYLRCPACKNCEKGKTNYALVLYDKLPTNPNALKLIELDEPVSFNRATITVEELLAELRDNRKESFGKLHRVSLNIARLNGDVIPFTINSSSEYKQKLINLLESEKQNKTK
jgi:tetratricopeptide (TPR) repeat protein